MSTYFFTLTQRGSELVAYANANNTPLQLSTAVFGNTAYNDSETVSTFRSRTTVRGEVYRTPISSVKQDPINRNWITIESLIPITVGGFTVSEIFILDNNSELVACGRFASTNKPLATEGAAKDIIFESTLRLTSNTNVTILVDEALVYSTLEHTRTEDEATSLSTTAFAANVVDGDAVYWDPATQLYERALANSLSYKQYVIGLADVTDSKLILRGLFNKFSANFQPTSGVKYYLSETVAGQLTSIPPASKIYVGLGIGSTIAHGNALNFFIDPYATTDAHSVDGYHVTHNIGGIPINDGVVNTNLNADLLDGYHANNASGGIPISNSIVCTNLNADLLDGKHAANTSGSVPISNTTLCVDLNADQLDGLHANNNSGSIPVSNGTVNTNLNADKLDGYHAGSAADNIPVSNGTLNTNLNADLLDGKHANNLTGSIPVSNTTKNVDLNSDMLDGYHAGNAAGNIPINNNVTNVGLDADRLDTYHASNATGSIPISNTTKNVDLNSDMLDGYHAGTSANMIPVSTGVKNASLNADLLDDLHAGNSSGSIPISNGTVNTNLNADLLDGLHAANTAGAIPISNGTLNTNLNADRLDGFHAGHASGEIPVSDSIVNVGLNAQLWEGHRWTDLLAVKPSTAGRADTAVLADNSTLFDGQNAAHYHNAANLDSGLIPLDRLPAMLTDKKAMYATYADFLSDGWEYFTQSFANNVCNIYNYGLPNTYKSVDDSSIWNPAQWDMVSPYNTYLVHVGVNAHWGSGTCSGWPCIAVVPSEWSCWFKLYLDRTTVTKSGASDQVTYHTISVSSVLGGTSPTGAYGYTYTGAVGDNMETSEAGFNFPYNNNVYFSMSQNAGKLTISIRVANTDSRISSYAYVSMCDRYGNVIPLA